MSEPACCDTHSHHDHKRGFDCVLYGSSFVIAIALLLHFMNLDIPYAGVFGHAVMEMLGKMWWGVLLGMTFVGLMSKIPREYFQVILGRGDTFGGIIRATIAGLFLDMCSHGIVLVGAKLYERGASLAQVMAFLIASPWNSLSLTIILVSLIGLKWTLAFIVGSAVVAIATGVIYKIIIDKGILPANPNRVDLPEGFSIAADMKSRLKNFKPNAQFFKEIFGAGWKEGRLLLRWLLLGIIIAAAFRAFIPADSFSVLFGPTLLGLGLTLVAATIIEVCSEGSTPIAGEILTRAAAPGNAFTFLMAGASTDYTEIMILREVTKSWKIALSLPVVTVPQIVLLGYIMNLAQ